MKLLPITQQRDRQAVSLYAALAESLWVIMGWASSKMYETANRAWQISHKINDPNQRFRLAVLLTTYQLVRGDLEQAGLWADQALELAEQKQSSPFLMMAYIEQAIVSICEGEFQLAQKYLKKA